jgi:hypothetical protein
MNLLLYLVLMVAASAGLKLIPARLKYNKSQYQNISGNKFFKTVFDKGNYGEFLTFCMLEKIGESNILTNIYLPQKDGTTTEIDLLAVNSTGIYVFESKNYSGWIFGDEKSRTWTQSLKGGKKNKFYNPIWQNKGHISALDEYLDKKYTDYFYSYIIFSERCELKKVNFNSINIFVIKRNALVRTLKKQIAAAPKKLSPEEVQDIYAKLKLKTLTDEDTKQRHIEEIKAKHSM